MCCKGGLRLLLLDLCFFCVAFLFFFIHGVVGAQELGGFVFSARFKIRTSGSQLTIYKARTISESSYGTGKVVTASSR